MWIVNRRLIINTSNFNMADVDEKPGIIQRRNKKSELCINDRFSVPNVYSTLKHYIFSPICYFLFVRVSCSTFLTHFLCTSKVQNNLRYEHFDIVCAPLARATVGCFFLFVQLSGWIIWSSTFSIRKQQ